MATEDAVCLAAQVAAHGDDVATALTACQEARRLRTAHVQLQSREIGRHVYHPAGAHAALRNRVMRARTPEQWYDQLDWLYAGTGPEGAVSPETVARR